MIEYFSIRIKKNMMVNQGHFYFDLIWKNNFMTRDQAYIWLAQKLNINKNECHFSKMNRTCIVKSIDFCIEYLNERYQLTDLPKYIRI